MKLAITLYSLIVKIYPSALSFQREMTQKLNGQVLAQQYLYRADVTFYLLILYFQNRMKKRSQ